MAPAIGSDLRLSPAGGLGLLGPGPTGNPGNAGSGSAIYNNGGTVTLRSQTNFPGDASPACSGC